MALKSFEEKMEKWKLLEQQKKEYREKNRTRYTRKEVPNWTSHVKALRKKQNQRYYKKHKEQVDNNIKKYYIQKKLNLNPNYIYRSNGKKQKLKWIKVYCDWCEKEYVLPQKQLQKLNKNFCCKKCYMDYLRHIGILKRQFDALKRKEIKKLFEQQNPINFQIIITKNGNQIKMVEKFYEKDNAIKYFLDMVNQNDNEIHIPKLRPKIEYEILLLKKLDPNQDNINLFPNQYGKLIPNVVVSPNETNWLVFNKEKYQMEELYSIKNSKNKCDALYIINNLILNQPTTQYIELSQFKNILFFKYDIDNISYVKGYHKNTIYNLINFILKYIDEYNNPHPNVIFMGSIDNSKKLIDYFSNFI
jgi:hypothetical protein